MGGDGGESWKACKMFSTAISGTHIPLSVSGFPIKHQDHLHVHRWARRGHQYRPCVAKLEEGRQFSNVQASQGSSFLSFLCPLLKLFGGGDPSAPRNAFLETATSGVSTLARLPWGSKVRHEIGELARRREQPPKALQLYEFEACPFCRRVREALTELDLSAEIYPCPKGSIYHRQIVKENGGKEQFPYLIDPNTGVCLYESGDIVKYLFQTYGGGKEPSVGLLESTMLTGWVPTILRAGRGMNRWQDATTKVPENKLELFSYENNQFARIVREALCELELPYVLHNVGFGSTVSARLQQIQGSLEVRIPFLVDPNTGTSLGNYQEILLYLFNNYNNTRQQ